MINVAELKSQLRTGYDFPPLKIGMANTVDSPSNSPVDALITVTLGDQSFGFAADCRARYSPRAFEEAVFSLEQFRGTGDPFPMLVVPYLREAQLDELLRRNLSGIDLSGNGVVVVPGRLVVYRTGQPNKYPDSAPTKYAYRGATSLVARAFLCRREFKSLADIDQEIQARGGNVVLSTISKALKRLESDVIVDRTAGSIRLRQPDKLLEALAANYTDPKVTKTVTLSVKAPLAELLSNVDTETPIIFSGRSSITAYAVMGREEYPVAYTTDVEALIRNWGDRVTKTSRFVDLELRQTADPTVYFDARTQQNLPYASPIQTFLECSIGDKREQEVALQVKELILRELDAR